MEAERAPKAKEYSDCMAGRDFEGQNGTRKAEKARPPAAKHEGINGSSVGGKTRRAPTKTTDEAAWK